VFALFEIFGVFSVYLRLRNSVGVLVSQSFIIWTLSLTNVLPTELNTPVSGNGVEHSTKNKLNTIVLVYFGQSIRITGFVMVLTNSYITLL
jgi:hypothetical protein